MKVLLKSFTKPHLNACTKDISQRVVVARNKMAGALNKAREVNFEIRRVLFKT